MSRIHTPLGPIFSLIVVIAAILIASTSAIAQGTTTTGAVVSSSTNTVTVVSAGGQYQLFVFTRDTRKPASLPVGTQVRVVSSPGNEPGVRLASEITVVQGTEAARTTDEGTNVPPEMTRIERDIERGLRRYQVGVRAGVALDPELVLLGVQGQVGPFFRSGVFFRPALDFGLGEVTAMFSLNGDVIYRLPFGTAQDRWSAYVGAGIGVNFVHQSFEGEEDGERIDFGEFDSDTALNILGGVRRRGGMFLEMKTSIYSDSSPTLRMTVGYTF
jgi:hypothetical protein